MAKKILDSSKCCFGVRYKSLKYISHEEFSSVLFRIKRNHSEGILRLHIGYNALPLDLPIINGGFICKKNTTASNIGGVTCTLTF